MKEEKYICDGCSEDITGPIVNGNYILMLQSLEGDLHFCGPYCLEKYIVAYNLNLKERTRRE